MSEIDPNPNVQTEAADATQPESAELARLREERDALLDRLARLQAEFDNFRKRAAREGAEFREFALADAIKQLLPVVDNFDLALKAQSGAEELRKGVELIRKQLGDSLERLGLKPVAATGEPFDPHVHEAIEMVESDAAPEHHVMEELQRGYKLKDRLLRPAMVRVATNPTAKASDR